MELAGAPVCPPRRDSYGFSGLPMQHWEHFDHREAYSCLKAIVEKVQPLGARVGSCGERKITLDWPEGETIHVRRFQRVAYRWLILAASGRNSLTLAQRDPSIRELQTALEDTAGPAGNNKERRIGISPIPLDLRSHLTELQRYSLTQLEGFGWSIQFVRRINFDDQLVVLVDPSGKLHGILRDDGSLDRTTDLASR
mgnify:FL=1